MNSHVLPSLRRVLFGSMLLLTSAACQRAERSDSVDTMTPPQDTTSSQNAPVQAAPVQAAPESPRSVDGPRQEQQQERVERIHVTGKDVDPNMFERERQEQERDERIRVTGKDHMTDRDDELQLGGGGMGGANGLGGSGGSHH
ncbi:MAG: hypothetical protein ABI895_23825 [Deltaproteobacteria bacterium]